MRCIAHRSRLATSWVCMPTSCVPFAECTDSETQGPGLGGRDRRHVLLVRELMVQGAVELPASSFWNLRAVAALEERPEHCGPEALQC